MMIAVSPCNLEKADYFHFVDDFSTPICALTKAIQSYNGDLSNSLIVLPEAFNLGHAYDPPGPDLPAREILEKLHEELAAPLRVTFVVGVLDGRTNAAYRVDPNGPELVCHKMGDDGKGLYDPCVQNPDRRNPIVCANARIGVLICMDATDDCPCIQNRRNDLLASLREGGGIKILCVPARFTNTAPNPLRFRLVIPDCWYVVSSGVYLNDSFVAHAHAPWPNNSLAAREIQATAPVGNQIGLWPLPETTSGQSGEGVGARG